MCLPYANNKVYNLRSILIFANSLLITHWEIRGH